MRLTAGIALPFLPLSTRRGALAGALALAGCAPGRSAPRDEIRLVGPWEIAGLSPASSGQIFARLAIAETLTNADDNGAPLPGLAASWQASSDRTVWRFRLRPGALFHDGTAVTAAAVVACLEAARTPPSVLAQAPIEAISAGAGSDGQVVTIRLARPHAGLLALLSHSSAIVLAPSSYEDTSVRAIVGSGPYRITNLKPPQTVEAVRFDGYDGARPAIAALRYLAVSRAETRALMAESGDADVAIALDPASLARLRTLPHVSVASAMIPRTVIVKVNAGLAGLRDVRMRQALSLAIDRQGIARGLLRDPELAATQLLSPALSGWHNSDLPALAHDPAAAKALLGQVGDAPRAIRLTTFPDRPELPLIAAALQEQWRAIGLSVTVNVGNSGDIPLAHRDGTLELGLGARNYANIPDPTETLLQDFDADGGDWGATGWSDPLLIEALDTLSTGAPGPKAVATARRTVTAVLHEALPVLPVSWYRQHFAVSARVRGLTIDPFERSWQVERLALSA
jgi:peptide/nickel transport system substrate-binding protein